MACKPNIDNMSFKPFTVNEHSATNSELDPDTNYFESVSALNTKCLTVSKIEGFISNIDSEFFPVLHPNIRSMKNRFEGF